MHQTLARVASGVRKLYVHSACSRNNLVTRLQLSSEVTGVPITHLYAGDISMVIGATSTSTGYGNTGDGLSG